MKKFIVSSYVGKRTPVNHYLVFDRSGSMGLTLSKLIDNVLFVQKTIPFGDSLSIAWFSGEGQYEWLLKAHIVGPDTSVFLMALLNQYRSTVGMTCFSEVLNDMKAVVKVTSLLSEYHSLMFFTDGFPVVRNLKKETENISAALSQLPITQALFVGYGSYYNKEFMARMAEAVNGSVVSASDITAVGAAYIDFVGQSNPLSLIRMEGSRAFYFTNEGFYPLKVEEGVALVPSNVKTFYTDAPGDDPIEALYALALSHLKAYKADKALEVLTKLGDVRLVNMLSDAFTDEEYAGVEQAVLSAANCEWERFLGGRITDYVSPNSTCVLDILKILADGNAWFYPGESRYKRIGVPQMKLEGYPDFTCFTEAVRMNKLVFNGERANVSIQTSVDGTIPVKYEGIAAQNVAVSQFRTYTVIKDGKLNMSDIEVGLDKPTFQALKKVGAVEGRFTIKRRINLTQFPLINRQTVALPSIRDVVEMKDLEVMLEARQKVLKRMIPDEAIKLSDSYPPDVCDYLASIGVNPTTMVYNPPTEKGETKDKYLAMRVQFKKKGFSSLPSVEAVLAAQNSGRALTNAQELIWNEYSLISPTLSASYLETLLLTTKQQLARIRFELSKVVFAIVVGKKWFHELSERDGATYQDYTISLNTIEVEI
jgi:hypothetical protein